MAARFSRLLLATEHTAQDTGAETLAFELARHCSLPLAGVLPVVSNPEFEAVAPQLAAQADARAAGLRAALGQLATDRQVVLDLQVRRGPEPYLEIVEEARRRGSDLLVIRRRGRRGLLANLLIGEMVSKVVAHSPCSVLVTPRDAHMWTRCVLVGVDPRNPDLLTVELAAGIAQDCGLTLHIVAVIDQDSQRALAEAVLASALSLTSLHGLAATTETRQGRPHEELIAAQHARDADLLVVGRHGGSTPMTRAWIGGTAQKVIGLAPCPVLVRVPASPT